jgi:hypothetical protein
MDWKTDFSISRAYPGEVSRYSISVYVYMCIWEVKRQYDSRRRRLKDSMIIGGGG